MVKQSSFSDLPKTAIPVTADSESLSLLLKLRSVPLKMGELCTINQGLRTGDNDRFLSETKSLNSHKPAVGGSEVGRYFVKRPFYVQYEPAKLDAPRLESIFTSAEKLVVQEIRNITLPRRIVAAYDDRQLFCLQSTNVINRRQGTPPLAMKFLLGLLNANLLNWFFRASFPSNNHIASNQLAQLPMPTLSLTKKADKMRHDEMVELVERMLELHSQLTKAKTLRRQESIQRQIAATDAEIDQLVYDLYGLTEAEIAIVEGRVK